MLTWNNITHHSNVMWNVESEVCNISCLRTTSTHRTSRFCTADTSDSQYISVFVTMYCGYPLYFQVLGYLLRVRRKYWQYFVRGYCEYWLDWTATCSVAMLCPLEVRFYGGRRKRSWTSWTTRRDGLVLAVTVATNNPSPRGQSVEQGFQ